MRSRNVTPVALSLSLHAAVGLLLAAGLRTSPGRPPQGIVETAFEAGLALDPDAVPEAPPPPEVVPPPATLETLREAVDPPEDPRFARDPLEADPGHIGLVVPGGRLRPPGMRPRGSPRGGRTDSGEGSGGQAAASVLPAPPPPPEPLFVVAKPVPGACPDPVYPVRERDRGVEGWVRLRVVVGADGAVREVEVARSSGSAALDRAAAEAVGRWRFEPATLDGTPVETAVVVPFHFRLTDP